MEEGQTTLTVPPIKDPPRLPTARDRPDARHGIQGSRMARTLDQSSAREGPPTDRRSTTPRAPYLWSFVPDFIAPSPDTLILGATFLGMSRALESLDIPGEAIQAWLAGRQLSPLQPDTWYPWQTYLDFYRWTRDTWGTETLHRFGREIPKAAKFPPEIRSLDRALKTLDIAYHMNHRGRDVGGYFCTHVGARKVHLHCENPYGCDFDLGILEGLILRFAEPGIQPTLSHAPQFPCRSRGAACCVYEVSW